MTPKEIQAELEKFRASIGPNAHTAFHITEGAHPIYAAVYPFGLCNDEGYLSLHADDWAEALQKLRDIWAKHAAEHRMQAVRKMALAIIRITADGGVCTDAALRQEFGVEQVNLHGADAVADANTIADKGPFAIVTMGGDNGAPVVVEGDALSSAY